jgi:hypothetical protein
MPDQEKREATVTDDEIQAIIDQGEAGIADLMAAYEPVERYYFNAVQAVAPIGASYSIDSHPA